MKTRRKLFISITAILLLLWTVAISAHQNNMGENKEGEHRGPMMNGSGNFMGGRQQGMDQFGAHHGMQGHGMMQGMGSLWMGIDLNDEQIEKASKIMNQVRKQHRQVMVKRIAVIGELEELYQADKLDVKAIGKKYDSLFKQKRALIEAQLVAQNKIRNMLTDEQRKQFKNSRRRSTLGGAMGMMGGMTGGHGGMMGGHGSMMMPMMGR